MKMFPLPFLLLCAFPSTPLKKALRLLTCSRESDVKLGTLHMLRLQRVLQHHLRLATCKGRKTCWYLDYRIAFQLNIGKFYIELSCYYVNTLQIKRLFLFSQLLLKSLLSKYFFTNLFKFSVTIF